MTAKMLFGFFVGASIVVFNDEELLLLEVVPFMFMLGTIGAIIGAALHLRVWRVWKIVAAFFPESGGDDSEE